MSLPSIQDILTDADASQWLKDALRGALGRDPVEAVNDAELLAAVLDARLRRWAEIRDSH